MRRPFRTVEMEKKYFFQFCSDCARFLNKPTRIALDSLVTDIGFGVFNIQVAVSLDVTPDVVNPVGSSLWKFSAKTKILHVSFSPL